MPCLPAAIRGTTQLKSLRCSAMGWKLQRADVDDVLQPLTQLLELDIPWMQCCDPPVFLHLFNTLRQLPPPAMWRQ